MLDQVAQADTLHRQALVWDNHACPPQENVEAFLPRLERIHESGVDVISLNIADSDVELGDLVRLAAQVRWFVVRNPDRYRMVRTAKDIREAKREGRLAIFFDVEGCYALGDQLSLVSLLFDIGVRWMAMVYNRRNLVGSGVHDAEDHGLTAFGHHVVAEMDRVGMLKCCSHTGYRTAMDVFAATSRPTILSHSNPRALRDHPRNVPDEVIRACAGTGGVVGLNGVGIFLGDNDIRIDTLVRHVDYVVQMVGAEHVGLGLDSIFDQASIDQILSANAHLWPPEFGYRPGMRFLEPEQLPELTEALLRRGYSETDVRGILGENLLRVAEDVWPAESDS